MIAQTTRDPWRSAWRFAISDGLLAVLLLGVAAGLVTTVWLPQLPSADPIAYARWLSRAQARFGNATPTMQALGLFAVTRSVVFRVLLALVADCLILRLIEGGDRLLRKREMAEPAGEWRALVDLRLSGVTAELQRRRYRTLGDCELFQADRWPWAELFSMLVYGGGLLLLIGLLLTHLWGWQLKGLTIQSGEQVVLPGTGKWIALDSATRRVAHSPGVVTSGEGSGPGMWVSATDSAGRSLALQRTAETEPVPQLAVALTEDQYLAIPEAQRIIRLAPQPSDAMDALTPVLVQIYRSPPGRLETEMVVEGSGRLMAEELTLDLTDAPYVRLTATFNPGRWPSVAGLVFLVVGLLGAIVWPARRFWLREEGEGLVGTGDLPPALGRARGG
jgi:hypothetical protein